MTISGIFMMTFLVMGLAVLCGVMSMALSRHVALRWMALALGIGVIESLALKDGAITSFDLVLVCITIPLSYACVGESVRRAFDQEQSSNRFFAAVLALIGLSIVLLQFPLPPVLQLVPCQLAGAWAMIRAFSCVRHNRQRGVLLDTALLVALAAVALVYVARIPFLPILVAAETPFMIVSRETLQASLIIVFAVLVPAVVVLTIAKVVANAVEFHRIQAEFDMVAALPNRRAFENAMRCETRGEGWLIFCDIDKFKLVNDRFGHAAGDAVIRAVAGLLEGPGLAARIGGEEFAIWLPRFDQQAACDYAEAMRREIASLRLVEIVGDHPITASFGIARVTGDAPLHEVFAAADTALYMAKDNGRNRVVTFEEQEWQQSGKDTAERRQRRAA